MLKKTQIVIRPVGMWARATGRVWVTCGKPVRSTSSSSGFPCVTHARAFPLRSYSSTYPHAQSNTVFFKPLRLGAAFGWKRFLRKLLSFFGSAYKEPSFSNQFQPSIPDWFVFGGSLCALPSHKPWACFSRPFFFI